MQSIFKKGEAMKAIEIRSNGNRLTGILLVLTAFTSLYPSGMAAGQVIFDHVVTVHTKGSQFTNMADIGRDGRPDILVFKEGAEGYISWYDNPGLRHHIIKKDDFNAGRPLAADVDRDGDMDLVVAENSNLCVYWYENPLPKGDPVKSRWIEHLVGLTKDTKKADYIKDYGVADFDRDGRRDIVVCTFDSPAEVFIYFQDDKDSWQKKTHKYINGHEGLDIGDLDGDGDPDVVTNGRWFETPENPRKGYYLEHSIDDKWYIQSGGWQRNATMVRVADIDANGRLDVVISHSEKEGYPICWYSAEDPKGTWTAHQIDPNYGWCQTLDVGDVDLDGDLDLLAGRFTRPSPPDVPEPHDVRVYYNPGDRLSVWTKQVVRGNGGIYFGHLADMDADGDLDIVGPRSYWTGPIEMWLNRIRGPEKSAKRPTNELVRGQLKMYISLSEMSPQMTFEESVEFISNTVLPKLNINVLWEDLSEKSNVSRTTPVKMEAVPMIRLGDALDRLVGSVSRGSVRIGYVVHNGAVIIAPAESLPRR